MPVVESDRNMRFLFRADASRQIGTGHVMRCLTLADHLRSLGHECVFICRFLEENLLAQMRTRHHAVHVLPEAGLVEPAPASDVSALAHSHWLGASQGVDARQSIASLGDARADWLIVDHYALDKVWESLLRPHVRRIMVIDDLADRRHDCDVLLDQTYGRNPRDYSRLVSNDCRLLCGSEYALLRPEFAALRSFSLQRRAAGHLKHLLITMGGVDKDNATGTILEVLSEMPLEISWSITVVMGASAPWLSVVQSIAKRMPWPTEVKVDVHDMAQLMASSDLAIGAAGSTSWERCCLGLPTLLVVLAENQWPGALALKRRAAALLIGEMDDIETRLPGAIEMMVQGEILAQMGRAASQITDGQGIEKLSELLDFENG